MRERRREFQYCLPRVPTFVPVDGGEGFILMCEYTGKEVVE